MKRLMIALLLCALPAVAVAQMVTCTDCTHEVSVYMGEGGFVAEAAAGAEMVTYVSHCGGVTSSGQIAPNADGLVAMLFTACSAEGARLELGPVMDGGWFWITDDMNSAVGPLVNQSVLMNATTDLTSAGAGVTMMAGRGAVYMKEMATGRVGILPNILPEAPMANVPPCGYIQIPGTAGNAQTDYAVVNTNCALGDGGVVMRGRGPVDPFTGRRALLEDGGTVVRPRAGSVTVLLDTWGNGSGHFTTLPYNGGVLGDPRAGHLGSGVPLFIGFMRGHALPTGPGAPVSFTPPAAAFAGLSISTADGVGTFTISPSTEYCGTAASPLHHAVPVVFDAGYFGNALAADPTIRRYTPPLPLGDPHLSGVTLTNSRLDVTFSLTVVCPP